MRKVIAAVLCLAAMPLCAQEDSRVTWLADHAMRIRTLDLADDDFRDLEPLRKTLDGVRVVMLGEQDHGDGTTFLAKTRLIRFLHETMGFDVLAFESGLYDCAKAWERLSAGEAARVAVPRGVFAIWTRSREVQPLIDYLGVQARSKHPLELAGVDSQLTGTASENLLVPDLAAVLPPKMATGEEWDRVVRVIGNLANSTWELGTEPMPSADEQAAFARTIERWRSVIPSAFWRQFLTSLRVFAEQTWRTDFHDHAANPAVFAMRDRQMGKNLVWLAKERYPKRKIIVWAATFHNARALGTIETKDPRLANLYPGVAPMGEVAWKELGNQLYSLGFTSYEGEWARAFTPAARPIPQPSRDSLEDLFARAGLTSAFVDFRGAPPWLHTQIAGQIIGHTEMCADWTRVVDGVVFLRKMERSHKQ
jgi:erythromycin esterase